MSAIRIPKGSINLAGLLFKPAPLPDKSKAPGLVVIHPGGGVKEQTASTYAKRLAERGFVAICYDASHQGDSEGLPHFLEDPAARVTDASAVVDYLQRLDYVDANRIAVVGICAGGGYAAAAAKGDHRLKAVAMVSAVNIGDGARYGWYGKDQPSSHVADLDQVAQAIQAEATQGAEAASAPYVPPKPHDDKTPVDLADAYDYYCTPRAQHKNAQNKMLLRSAPLVLNFDAWQFADLFLTQPVLIVVGEKAESRWHSEKIYKILDGKNDNVKKVVVPNGRHMDFYDKDDFVNPAIDNIVDFFKPLRV
ncbi:uncharacterized protein Z520_06644 [Fonsecaea multimorphosa CBS 102226]|uniref:Xaa-Pro dipeptidyl-peptidase-like domain-containing protein n=1 Tax=Fonsecaea multimorphosa CBS 102226 TaxID=1442371 RepID=A0A0D2ILI3_9EURO|nr:uncharacterized protein Z520_06644 [Fonsecaea multimorphosa CBS 102226]KIX97866.1 hypothetical protein Z520_06644 [Fonsecaea multimorphosa CBS 102226]OAL23634.1 hypothetical protein AYO22_06211 [Fonsecaea multimorphosa]